MRVAVKLRLFFVKRLASSEKKQYLLETFRVCSLFCREKGYEHISINDTAIGGYGTFAG